MYDYSISVLEKQLQQGLVCFENITNIKNKEFPIKFDRNEILKRLQDLQKSINKLKEFNHGSDMD